MEEYQKPEIRSEKIEIGVYGTSYNGNNRCNENSNGVHNGFDCPD